MLYYTILYCIVLYYIVLYCIKLCYSYFILFYLFIYLSIYAKKRCHGRLDMFLDVSALFFDVHFILSAALLNSRL